LLREIQNELLNKALAKQSRANWTEDLNVAVLNISPQVPTQIQD